MNTNVDTLVDIPGCESLLKRLNNSIIHSMVGESEVELKSAHFGLASFECTRRKLEEFCQYLIS